MSGAGGREGRREGGIEEGRGGRAAAGGAMGFDLGCRTPAGPHGPFLQPGGAGALAVSGRRPLGGVPGVVRRHRTLRGLTPRAAVGGAGGPRLRRTRVRARASKPRNA